MSGVVQFEPLSELLQNNVSFHWHKSIRRKKTSKTQNLPVFWSIKLYFELELIKVYSHQMFQGVVCDKRAVIQFQDLNMIHSTGTAT